MPKNHLIGLTGGIGSGKSTVAKFIREAGIPVIDSDSIGHQIVKRPSNTLDKIIELFLSIEVDCLGKNKELDKKKVSSYIFQSPKLKEKLEKIIHPVVYNSIIEKARELHNAGNTIIVVEGALLIETGLFKEFQPLIVVSSCKRKRIERVISRDNLSREMINNIIMTQVRESFRLKCARWVITNDSTLEDLEFQTRLLLKRFRRELEGKMTPEFKY